jgi:hypothetical protein
MSNHVPGYFFLDRTPHPWNQWAADDPRSSMNTLHDHEAYGLAAANFRQNMPARDKGGLMTFLTRSLINTTTGESMVAGFGSSLRDEDYSVGFASLYTHSSIAYSFLVGGMLGAEKTSCGSTGGVVSWIVELMVYWG